MNQFSRHILARAILAELMLCGAHSPEIIDRITSVLTEAMMPDTHTRIAFKCIHAMRGAEKWIDMASVAAEASLHPTVIFEIGQTHPGKGNVDWWAFMLFEYHYAARLHSILLPFKAQQDILEILLDIKNEPSRLDTVDNALGYLLDGGGVAFLKGNAYKQLAELRDDLSEHIGRIQMIGFYSKPKYA